MIRAAAAFIFALGLSAQTVTFTKEFPGSKPAYTFVSVSKNGALEYKESLTDDQPVKAQMSADETASLFDMASKLNFFKDSLESGLKVARTGKKTFRYEDGSGKISEAVFNYSLNPLAQQLLDRFENIAASERAYISLEETSRFDKLGVNDALAEIESLWLKKELAAPSQFVPLLNQVASHESYMHLARDRAARLRDEFRAASAAAKAAPAGAK
ncbi:MAG: hypothetical protein WAM39_13715 [Bryobacteraceae bacterium]